MHQDDMAILSKVLHARHSVRGFLPAAVPQELLDEIFQLAQTAPSNCNTQPWFVHVASGTACQRLKSELAVAVARGDYAMDFPYVAHYSGEYKLRQYDAANCLYMAMGIERSDKVARDAAFQRNFCFFGAPHVAFLFLPREFGIREAADLGMYAQNLMIAMTAAGLGSCAQTALSFNADLVRKVLGVPENMRLLFGISFGYEDKRVAANKARTSRASLQQTVTFHE